MGKSRRGQPKLPIEKFQLFSCRYLDFSKGPHVHVVHIRCPTWKDNFNYWSLNKQFFFSFLCVLKNNSFNFKKFNVFLIFFLSIILI